LHHYHTRGTDGLERFYNVHRLWELSQGFPVVDVAIESLDLSGRVWFHGQCPTIAEVIKHYEKVLAADLDFPIILDEQGRVMDGFHRIVKARLQGDDQIAAVRFEINPEADEIRPRQSQTSRGVLAQRVQQLRVELHHEHDRLRAAIGREFSAETARQLGALLLPALETIVIRMQTALTPLIAATSDDMVVTARTLANLSTIRHEFVHDERFLLLAQSDQELGIPARFVPLVRSALDELESLITPLVTPKGQVGWG